MTMTDKTTDPLLEDAPKAVKAKGNGKAKAKATKPAAKPAKAKAKTAGDATMGRPASEQTLERRKKVLQFAKAKNGIDNVALAEKLGCTTAQSQMVCRTLVSTGKLKMAKDRETGRVTYRAA
jgi:hypothetical protein